MHKKIAILAIFITLFSTGCSPKTEEPKTEIDENMSSITELHPDIYLSTDVTWKRSSFSGPVEQYDLWLNSDAIVFAQNAKTFMAENSWTLTEDSTSPIVLRFTKNDWLITYSIQDSGQMSLFVEPTSLYE